jgi:hypothetical protein
MDRMFPPLVFGLLCAGLECGCSRIPNLTELDERANGQARAAPLVVVGVADSDISIGPTRPQPGDPNYPTQLHKVRVQVENVLRGSLLDHTIFVYYFGFAGGFDGPRPLGFARLPSRRVLWLRKEAGVLRMASDGWDGSTMFVSSGSHPHYHVDPQKSLDYALVDILLTRGEGEVNDLQFGSQIMWGVPDQGLQDYVIAKLRHLAETESPDVKGAACKGIWIYTQDRIGSTFPFRGEAEESLQAAQCQCHKDPSGNPVCE